MAQVLGFSGLTTLLLILLIHYQHPGPEVVLHRAMGIIVERYMGSIGTLMECISFQLKEEMMKEFIIGPMIQISIMMAF